MKDRLLRVPVLGTALRVQERYTADAADALAAAIGLFGFLSLFPLVALALAVAGFVVGDDVLEQARVVRAIQQSIPAFAALAGDSTQLNTAMETIAENAGSLLSVGSVFLLLAGLRIASGAQQAGMVVFRAEKPSGLQARLGQLGALAVVGLLAVAGTALGGSVGVDLGSGVEGAARSVVLTGVTFAVDVAVFAVAYRLFTPGPGPSWRVLLPGSVLAGAGWVALKLFGTSYVSRQAASAENDYGALGSIIALLLLFYLAGRLYLYGAELAALLAGIDDEGPELLEQPSRVPEVSPRPPVDREPAPADLVRLALTAVGVAAVAGAVDRALRGGRAR